jgi:hypothetical protein
MEGEGRGKGEEGLALRFLVFWPRKGKTQSAPGFCHSISLAAPKISSLLHAH